jgi:hypothetical protein
MVDRVPCIGIRGTYRRFWWGNLKKLDRLEVPRRRLVCSINMCPRNMFVVRVQGTLVLDTEIRPIGMQR